MNKRVFCVNNVSKEYTCNDIETFLTDRGIRVISCFVAKTRIPDCTALRVCVTANCLEKFLDPNTWPLDVVITEWFFKPKENQSNRNGAN